jgi:membrane-bound lytic murein transglycosylase D
MKRLRSILNSGPQQLTLAAVLLFAIGHAWPQTIGRQDVAASDPFTSLDASLSNAAEKALAAPIKQLAIGPGTSVLPAAGVAPATAKASVPTRAIQRVQQLRPVLEPILREEKVPPELAAIVLVESGGQRNALSPRGARGIWQFMPDTARRYGLIVSPERDERLDIQRSTRAAARYLRDLHDQFGDWRLAFAAYNAGEGLVQQAINRNGTRDFARLSGAFSIPLETRRYVPAVVNATKMFSQPDLAILSIGGPSASWKVYAYTSTEEMRQR